MPIRRDFTFTSAAGRRLRAFYAEPETETEAERAATAESATGAGAGPEREGSISHETGTEPATRPAVIVVHEIMGLNDDIRRIATRFADSGYVALAPDLVGDGFKPFCIARFVQGMGRVASGRPYREMAAFQDWLMQRPLVDADRVGMAGFCAGGGFAILYAARGGRELRAIAPFYGALPTDESIIPDVCPVVASYGGRDRRLGKTGPKLQAALDSAGRPRTISSTGRAPMPSNLGRTRLRGRPRRPRFVRCPWSCQCPIQELVRPVNPSRLETSPLG